MTDNDLGTADLLRALPAVDEVLRSDGVQELRRVVSDAQLVAWVRSAIAELRRKVLSGNSSSNEFLASAIERVRDLWRQDTQLSARPVINATGVLLHTNLGRAPLAREAIERMQKAAAYTNVEIDLLSGKRSSRGGRVCRLLAQLTGADDALVVNNCAAATMLALAGVAHGREVIVSRGQLVEIGGGFRLPDVFRASGVHLNEVGTTNRTYLSDYRSALNGETGAILRVHRSNFSQVGFVTEPTIAELATIKRPESIALIDDVGSGAMVDLEFLGLREPTIMASVSAGPDLTLFSGDKLFGGPQCGIIVGRARWTAQLRSHPMMRAMRVDKVTLAGLEATVEIHLAGRAQQQLPLYQLLCTSASELESRCQRIVESLSPPPPIRLQVIRSEASVGGGTLPGATLPSCAIEVRGVKADVFAKQLRIGEPAIVARIADDCVVLDLRSVLADDLQRLGSRLSEVLTGGDRAGV